MTTSQVQFLEPQQKNSPTATYTIVATNTGGNATVTVSITVNDVVPSAITYSGSPFTLTNGVAMSANTPSAAGGAVDSWSISPALPTGLTFDTATGEISGTPTVISPLTTLQLPLRILAVVIQQQ